MIDNRSAMLVLSAMGVLIGTLTALLAHIEGWEFFRTIMLLAAFSNVLTFFYAYTRK